jgi:EamA domain-containing membrane protein RarD
MVIVTSRNNMKGIIIMVFACAFFGVVGLLMKLAYDNNPNLTAIDVLFTRSVVMFPVYYVMAKVLGVDLIKIRLGHFGILITR